MKFKNLLLLLSRQFSRLQRQSDAFWTKAGNTYLATEPEIYEQREAVLRSALATIGPVRSAVDFGCGDGRFTLVLRDAAETVVGYDISAQLIASARGRLVGDDTSGVSFEVAELEQVPASGASDLVACLGVTSCLVDDAKFGRVLDRLVAATAVGGHLLMVDTLSDGKELTRAYRSGYVGKYRERSRYEAALRDRGMSLVERRQIASMGEPLANNFYLFRRTA